MVIFQLAAHINKNPQEKEMQNHNYPKMRNFVGPMFYARGADSEKQRKPLSPCDRQILERLLGPVRQSYKCN